MEPVVDAIKTGLSVQEDGTLTPLPIAEAMTVLAKCCLPPWLRQAVLLVDKETGILDAESDETVELGFATEVGTIEWLSCATSVLLKVEDEPTVTALEDDLLARTWFPAAAAVAVARTLAAADVDPEAEPAETLPTPALARTDFATVETSTASMAPPAALRADKGFVLV